MLRLYFMFTMLRLCVMSVILRLYIMSIMLRSCLWCWDCVLCHWRWDYAVYPSCWACILCLSCVSIMLRLCIIFLLLVVTCWDGADLLALVCGVLLWVCYSPIGILGQVWYLIVSIPDICTLTYFVFSPSYKDIMPIMLLLCFMYIMVRLKFMPTMVRLYSFLSWFNYVYVHYDEIVFYAHYAEIVFISIIMRLCFMFHCWTFVIMTMHNVI